MGGSIWISDREPGIRQLFAELVPQSDVLTPAELESRLRSGQRPHGLVIDGTQLLELSPALRRSLLALPRLLVCTGIMLAAMPRTLISGPGVAVLAKPFCVEDLEASVDWLRGCMERDALPPTRTRPTVQPPRQRSVRRGIPAS